MIYNTALSGALAAQAALDITSNNTANVMTPGYTRQGAVLAAQVTLGLVKSPGAGVDVVSLRRFSDSYKSQQMWQANSNLGQYDAAQPYLTQLEKVMGDTTSNIDSGIDAFLAALNAATLEPTSTPLRDQVITTANALAQRFNSLGELIDNQRTSVFRQRTAMVEQTNTLLESIAALNQKIADARGTGTNASGVIDERDNKIDELAGLIGIQVVDQADGTRSVSLRSGQPLVFGSLAAKLALSTSGGSQSLKLDFVKESFALPDTGLGGSIGGLGDFEHQQLLPLKSSLVQLAQQIAGQVNTQLAAGYDLGGTAGAALFTATPAPGSIMQISGTITAQTLAFSSSATLAGDSANLLQLLDSLKSSSVTLPTTGTVLLADAHAQLVGRLAMQSQQNQVLLSTATTVRDQAVQAWKSTSGVNLNEEAVNLMQFTQMYQANMKVIAVANQLFDSMLAAMN